MIRCLFGAALFFCLCGCVADGFVITEVGADEVIKERKVERSVKVVPYVEPPPKEIPGSSGVAATSAADDYARGSRCSGGKCKSVAKSLKRVVHRRGR